MLVNDFVIKVATVNGTGSQSTNQILAKTIFRMGVPVGTKNMFPSNIAGLPTWFSLRVSEKGFVSYNKIADILVAMNDSTWREDFSNFGGGGVIIVNSDMKSFDESLLISNDEEYYAIPCTKLVAGVSKDIKLRKFLTNMVYLGAVAEYLSLDADILDEILGAQFSGKKASTLFEVNQAAMRAGASYMKEALEGEWKPSCKIEKMTPDPKNQIMIDGNTAGALGMIYGGCTVLPWYPITPSSSMAEAFGKFVKEHRQSDKGVKAAVIQAEDEMAAIGIVVGAGWAGARAATCTSGPGLSLMSEMIGLAYFAEIPVVVWDIQRMGPSTGLPTRTSQGDILAAAKLSHGDTNHVLLFPSTPEECFDFGTLALDLAEQLQTPVFVMSDLDLGMNMWMSPEFQESSMKFRRGKVLSKGELEHRGGFSRYKDEDGDGIPYRTLPGTPSKLAAYFTRGTGHDENANYSEKPENYQKNLDRLRLKWETAGKLVPAPEVDLRKGSYRTVLYYGSTSQIIPEVQSLLKEATLEASFIRVRAYPFGPEVEDALINGPKVIYVVEQNDSGQLCQLLRDEYADYSFEFSSITTCDGEPITAEFVFDRINTGNFEQDHH